MRFLTFDKQGQEVRLEDLPTEPPQGLKKDEAAARMEEIGQELFELQDLLYGARTHSVLVVLQGRDSAGKDGAIKHVAGCMNPRGVSVVSFGVPTKEEQEHDFLWRVHKNAPRKGEFAFFNRSHYEDVLVVRVNDLCPESLWRERYGHIRDFEELLCEHDTIVLKYFLHISKGEQEERLLEREKSRKTAWKVNAGDWRERERWGSYTKAYEEAISRCSTERAPFIVVPADAKWYRNLVIAESILDALRPYRKGWEKALDQVGEKKSAELAAYRAAKP